MVFCLLKVLIWQDCTFCYKKRFPDLLEIALHISGKKGKEPVRYVRVRKIYVIHPKHFWTSQNFREINAGPPARYFSLCRGYPLPFFVVAKSACMFFSVSVLLFALVERLCFSRMRDFLIPYLIWKLVISHSYFSNGKIFVLAFLHT